MFEEYEYRSEQGKFDFLHGCFTESEDSSRCTTLHHMMLPIEMGVGQILNIEELSAT